jgi:hypothetical protein
MESTPFGKDISELEDIWEDSRKTEQQENKEGNFVVFGCSGLM